MLQYTKFTREEKNTKKTHNNIMLNFKKGKWNLNI